MNVLIISENTKNWQLFATWFSVQNQNVSLCITRNKETPFMFFQWAKRLRIPHYFCEQKFPDPIGNYLSLANEMYEKKFFDKSPLLILTDTMLVHNIDFEQILTLDENSAFIPNILILEELINKRIIDNFETPNKLSIEAKEKYETHSVISYKKGVGRWIDKLKGCPFSNAAGLATDEMTTNEFLVIDSWKKMTPLYQATV